jgi:FkbM family methyltransferase
MHWLLLQRLHLNLWVKAPLFFGAKMWVLTGETTSRGLLAFGYSETALTALMLETLRPGMHFVDVGAHLGYEALLASTLVGESGRVVSFEPQSRIARWAMRSLRPFSQARVVRSAVADFNGEMEFHELEDARSAFSSAQSGGLPGRLVRVPVVTLSSALAQDGRPADFIKVDVEGGELSVLRGARALLERDRPLLVLEAEMPAGEKPRPRVRQFDEFLSPLGYRGVSFDFDGQLRLAPLERLEVGHANVAFVPVAKPEFSQLVTGA